jgi:hypothetical protein
MVHSVRNRPFNSQHLHHVRPVEGEGQIIGPHRDRGYGNRSGREQVSAGRRPAPHALSERYGFLKQYYNYWLHHPGVQAVRVGYEVFGAQADTEVIEEYQQRDGQYFEVVELNYPRQGPHSKRARVERLEPDMKSGRFYLPAVVWNPDAAERDLAQHNACLWSVWSKENHEAAEAAKQLHAYAVGQILYRPLRKATRLQRWCEVNEQMHRIVRPLKRMDEDGDVYDLTRAFMEEARFFPPPA